MSQTQSPVTVCRTLIPTNEKTRNIESPVIRVHPVHITRAPTIDLFTTLRFNGTTDRTVCVRLARFERNAAIQRRSGLFAEPRPKVLVARRRVRGRQDSATRFFGGSRATGTRLDRFRSCVICDETH